MALENVWASYSDSCVCGYKYDNNCAHFLSNALILGGFSQIDGGVGDNFRIVNGFCVCRSGRPVRAKELRTLFFAKSWKKYPYPGDGLCLVYQERASDGQGNVLLKRYRAGNLIEYRGTGDFPTWRVQEYYF